MLKAVGRKSYRDQVEGLDFNRKREISLERGGKKENMVGMTEAGEDNG